MHYAGHANAYAAFGPDANAPYGSMLAWKPQPMGRKRMNVWAICINVFVPWIAFCLVFAMMSFEMHYKTPDACQTILMITVIVLALALLLDFFWIWLKRRAGEASLAGGSWIIFLVVSCLAAVFSGVIAGNYNFWTSAELFYDITALNSYNAVDPTRMRGQELMDAGRALFVPGTHLDLTRSMGFKNMDTYCVAPITGGTVAGNPPLASYDFWAVGKDCCSSSATGGDFRCGQYDNANARGGLRLMRDEDRAFFRLAVQQAESAYQIKATHPLFFNWVEDPIEATYQFQRNAFQTYFIGMCSFFGFQMLTVYIAASCFVKFSIA